MARRNTYQQADTAPLYNLVLGINRSVAPTRIEDLGLSEAWNVVIDDGRILPRPGARASTRYGAELTANPCSMFGLLLNRSTGVFTPYRAESNFGTNQLEFFSYGGGSWTSRASGLTTSRDTPPMFAQFKDEAIFVPGDGDMYRWNPTTLALATINSQQATADLRPPAAARFVIGTGSRVFAANGRAPNSSPGSERFSSRVWWSTTGDATIWSNGTGIPERRSASYVDLQHDTYPITGLVFHSGQQVIAFKDWSVYFAQWRGSPIWYDFVPMSTRIGCVASKTIRQWRDQVLFLGADCNIYAIALNGRIQAVGDKIQPHLASIANYDRLKRSVAVVDTVDNFYWLFVPTESHAGQFGRHIFCMNLLTGAWTEGEFVDTGIEILDAFQARTFDELPFLVLGGADGRIYEFDYQTQMTDRATTFDAYIWSKVYDFMEMLQQVGENGEFHKMALHGATGKAYPRFRTGRTIRQVEASTSTKLLAPIDQDLPFVRDDLSPTPYHTSSRTNAERFGQWGVYWAAGESAPMELDGVTAWVKDR